MSNLKICDLAQRRDLDHHTMSSVQGGRSWLSELGPVANVNVAVNQNIAQLQEVQVNALNNVGVIGAGFGPLQLDVSPQQWASARAAF